VPFPTNVKFLATVDENTLATKRSTHPGHGRFHPVAWCQYYDGGRAWLTTLGHDGRAFTDGSGFSGQAQFKQLIVNGIKSAMGPHAVLHEVGGSHPRPSRVDFGRRRDVAASCARFLQHAELERHRVASACQRNDPDCWRVERSKAAP
jgi:hypothetical protein